MIEIKNGIIYCDELVVGSEKELKNKGKGVIIL